MIWRKRKKYNSVVTQSVSLVPGKMGASDGELPGRVRLGQDLFQPSGEKRGHHRHAQEPSSHQGHPLEHIGPDHRLQSPGCGVKSHQDAEDHDDEGHRKTAEGLDGQGDSVEDDAQPKHLEEDEAGTGVEPGPGPETAFQIGVGRGEPAGSKEGHEQEQRRQISDEIGHVAGDVTPVLLEGEAGHGQEGHGADDGGHQ